MAKWLVERSKDNFETVIADNFGLTDGDVSFHIQAEFPKVGQYHVLTLARGQWLTITEDK